jgi:hypothetical protein
VGAITGSLALFFSLGGQFVFAHGGDGTKIHACVNDITGEIQILADTTGYGDPNTACPASQVHALDWNGSGMPGPTGPPGPPLPPDPSARAGGVAEELPPTHKLSKVTHGKVKLFKKSIGPGRGASKNGAVVCPSSHPNVLEGGALTTVHQDALFVGFLEVYPAIDFPYPVEWLYNHATAQGWTAYALRDDVGLKAAAIPTDKAWKLTVWVKCSV